MFNIWQENEVTIEKLIEHLSESGMRFKVDDKNWIRFETDRNLGYRLNFVNGKPFLRLSTFLPTSSAVGRDILSEYVRKLSSEVFLAGYHLDDDDDVFVQYVISYSPGIIPSQLMQLIMQFRSLIDYIVFDFTEGEIFDFDKWSSAASEEPNASGGDDRPRRHASSPELLQ